MSPVSSRFAAHSLVRFCFVALLGGLFASPAMAQFKDKQPESDKGVTFGETRSETYRFGVTIRAAAGGCKNLFATAPMPIDWPEQEVRIIEEKISPSVRKINYRTTEGLVKQMLVEVPQLGAGEEAEAIVKVEIKRRAILPPADTSIFKIPERPARDVAKFLGPSPFIESRNPQIKSFAKEAVEGVEGDWKKVEAIYDKVREKVKYVDCDLKGALAALRDGDGDCEELTSLFVACCRVIGVPARSVWVPGHTYPEFYLLDAEGKGHWFPCQAAGDRAFGEMPEMRPILQKGDNFKVPEKKEPQRYVAEFLRGTPIPGGGQPRVRFIRESAEATAPAPAN